jgi:predicted dehydrogenase
VRLCALSDVFPQRVAAGLASLARQFNAQVDVPTERQFVGFDAFRKAIDAVGAGGVVLLCTPPAFRPIHFEYAVRKGVHVFMEKSFAVDGPGVRRVLAAGRLAEQKGLKVAGGLMCRHNAPLEAAIERIHSGAIGELVTCWAYRQHGPVGFAPKKQGESDLAHQIRNYSCFTWLNGSFLLDWLIHNIDVCCWAKRSWPVLAQGQGGRQVRTAADQLFDHYAAEFTFPDGSRLMAQGRHMDSCWNFFGSVLHGANGSAVLGEGISRPRLFKSWRQTSDQVIWQHDGADCDPYQREHDLFFEAIRNDKPWNETERCAKACLSGIMGRMAVESGKQVTAEQALASSLELAPRLDSLTWDSPAPVLPEAGGCYAVASPGRTSAL